ncbi:MAG: hypothetical protein PHI63_00835 [Patescibacteria group bacterium]|nr:hypothetical protein [Patescibacteria group bacterium]
MEIFVFGNPDLPGDALPLQLLPKLRQQFPTVQFQVVDPNEEWAVPERLVVLDTVVGVDRVTVFSDLKKFVPAPNVTLHDFDAYANLRYLQKLGHIKEVLIIGVPPAADPEHTFRAVTEILKQVRA